MNSMPTIATMHKAFASKDSAYDGIFFTAVKTTGIFCRPTCRAKPAKPENLEFFSSADEAVRNGYRPCKLCRPTENSAQPPLVRRLMELAEQEPEKKWTESELAAVGITASVASRQFRAYCNMTFAAYQRSRRIGLAAAEIRSGTSAIVAQTAAGFESASGFRDALTRMFGESSGDVRQTTMLIARWISTPLGPMLAIAADEGLVALDFLDRKGMTGAIERLRRRFGRNKIPAVIAPGNHPHLTAIDRELEEYFAGLRQTFNVPLSPAGTAFERRAWKALSEIPYGQTLSYGQQAVAMGSNAVRAVGRANGMNYLSIVIPCHRVIGSDGKLTGYGGGLARKAWLLDHERRHRQHL
jgi:AraC family transcriptional regulator of adaptative response/methylated-DNA-[protein]-cysteine methyltransferase